jgi:hypothetical protein
MKARLPILIGNPMASIDWMKSTEEASLSCHEWQHGSHIDSLPKQPQGDEPRSGESKRPER